MRLALWESKVTETVYLITQGPDQEVKYITSSKDEAAARVVEIAQNYLGMTQLKRRVITTEDLLQIDGSRAP